MEGKYILYKRHAGLRRIDIVAKISKYLTLIFLIITFSLAILLIIYKKYTEAISIFLFSSGLVSYMYSVINNQLLIVKESSQKAIEMLKESNNSLMQDEELLKLLTGEKVSFSDLNVATKFKLRLILSTHLDAYTVIFHYIRRGYFSRSTEFAAIYENRLKSLFENNYMIEIWESKNIRGKGTLKEEYDNHTNYVVNNVIKVIKKSSNETN